MNPDYKWHLATKFLTDTLAAEEKTAWEELLQNDPIFYEEFKKVEAHWKNAKNLPYDKINVSADWELVLEKVRKEKLSHDFAPHRRTSWGWLKYAAVITVACLAGMYVWLKEEPAKPSPSGSSFTRIEAPAGSKTFVTLPDGSTVWLNAGSRLSFDNAFNNGNRDLHLEGEAFFDVVKKDIPFTVHTQYYDIAVLGTAFNVSAYPDDKEFVTTLVRGSLKVVRNTSDGDKEEILLKPNEQVVLRREPERINKPSTAAAPAPKEEIVVETEVDVENETAWKDGWLAMQGESLEELSRKMERLYNIKIEFRDESLKHYRYTGRIRQLSLEQVLKALSLTSPVKFAIDEQTVVLSENKQTKSKYQSLQTPRP